MYHMNVYLYLRLRVEHRFCSPQQKFYSERKTILVDDPLSGVHKRSTNMAGACTPQYNSSPFKLLPTGGSSAEAAALLLHYSVTFFRRSLPVSPKIGVSILIAAL